MNFLLAPSGLPARSVYCVGRNYAEHAKELGNEVPSEPLVFLKPVSALCRSGQSIVRPPASRQVDHEVELVVVLSNGGRDIPEHQALDLVWGYGVGIDVTARDLQEQAKKKGQPWTVAKGFDTFAPVSEFLPRAQTGDGPFHFTLSVNGMQRQDGRTEQMIFSVPRLIHYLSTIFTLAPGDVLFTGTPAGVGPLLPGDEVVAELAGGQARVRMGVE